MNTDAIPADILADLEALAAAASAGRKPDADLTRRVRERAERARHEVFTRNGVLEIGVAAIRSFRDGDEG